MNIGVSTANLYPNETEKSFEQLLKLGFRTFEVFLNTETEVKPDFIKELKQKADAYDARIVALHPYTSGIEPYLLFSQYKRRFEDGYSHYRKIYEAAYIVNASYVIMHGDKLGGVLSKNEVFERYEQLFDLGKTMGVTLLQENVVNYRSSELSYITSMRKALKDKACFTFDIKQCKRCGLKPKDVITAMGNGLKHVHISDQNSNRDCMIPGTGNTNYKILFESMEAESFKGDWIIELYRSNFGSAKDLLDGYRFLICSINS